MQAASWPFKLRFAKFNCACNIAGIKCFSNFGSGTECVYFQYLMICDKLRLVIKIQASHQQHNRILCFPVPWGQFTCEYLIGKVKNGTTEGTRGCGIEKLGSSLSSATSSLCELLCTLCFRFPTFERKLNYKSSRVSSNYDNV